MLSRLDQKITTSTNGALGLGKEDGVPELNQTRTWFVCLVSPRIECVFECILFNQ